MLSIHSFIVVLNVALAELSLGENVVNVPKQQYRFNTSVTTVTRVAHRLTEC